MLRQRETFGKGKGYIGMTRCDGELQVLLSREECPPARAPCPRAHSIVRGVPSADTGRRTPICSPPLSHSISAQPWIIVLTREALDLNSHSR